MIVDQSEAFRCTYLLPIRRVYPRRAEIQELTHYFRDLARAGCEVIVVDGSSRKFSPRTIALGATCAATSKSTRVQNLNGKVTASHRR